MTRETKPARDYSWPPFEEGNTAALVHGAESERAVNAPAVEVHAELLRYAPYLNEDKFLPAVNRYLQAAAPEALLHEFILKTCDDKGPGAVPSRTWEQATAASRLSAKLGSDLGLDVIGHARIRALTVGAEVGAASLDGLMAEGRAIRQRRDPSLQATETAL
jgi:hypothetical protein